MEAIAHRSQLLLGQQSAAIAKAANTVAWQATAKPGAAGRDLAHLKAQMGWDAARLVTTAAEALDCGLATVAHGASQLVEVARREIEASTRIVVGLGPQATLRRGFAIARDAEDRPLTTREAALRFWEFS